MEHVETTSGGFALDGVGVAAPSRASRRRAARIAIVASALLIALVGAMWLVRTESVAGGVLDARLAELRERSGVRVVRSDVEPVGLTGVALHNVIVRRPDDGGSLWLAVERVEVYPDLLAALTGEAWPARIVLRGVELNVVLGEGEQGDLALIRRLRGGAGEGASGEASGAASVEASGVVSSGVEGLSRLPEVELIDAHVRIEDRAARIPDVVFDSRRLRVGRESRGASVTGLIKGDINLVGYSPGVLEGEFTAPARVGRLEVIWERRHALADVLGRHIDEPRLAEARIEARGVALVWPAAIALRDARIDGVDLQLPWSVAGGGQQGRPRITGLEVGEISLSRTPERIAVASRDVALMTALPGLDQHRVPLGDARVDYDRMTQRLVAGVDFHGALGLGSATARWDARKERLEVTAKVSDVPVDPYTPLTPEALERHVDLRSGRLSGTVLLDVRADLGTVELHTDLDLADGTLRAPILAQEELKAVNVGAKMHVRADLDSGVLTLSDGILRTGALRVETTGRLLTAGDHWELTLDARAPRITAQEALEGIPSALIPMLQGYRLGGHFGGVFKLKVDTRSLDDTALDVQLDVDDVQIVQTGPRSPIPQLKGDFSLVANGLPDKRTIGPGHPGWVVLSELPEVVPQAITSAEDARFFEHHGFDMAGIKIALIRNVEAGRLTRGGSTISQQVIKNLFLNHNRTVSRKLQEVFLTWHLEREIPKSRILEIYLSMLHLGPDIYGLHDASRVLFCKKADRLSLREAVFLGSILPNPDHFIRLYSKRMIPIDRRTKMRNILSNMNLLGFITEGVRDKASSLTDQGVISIATPPKLENL